ncbi:MAG TPA: glycosyltransferase [Nitriliruptorales bacterium]|nr:glycosyltransferase [Nitriliruptorales bacterium]
MTLRPQPRLRVLLVTHVFPRHPDDPAAPFLLRYARGLVAAGTQLRVLAPHDPGLPDDHEVAGIPVRRVRYAHPYGEDLAYRGEMHLRAASTLGAWKALRLVGALVRAVRQEVRRWRPDVLDVHWLVPGGVVAYLAHVPMPAQVVVHGTDLALVTAGSVRRALARRVLARFDAVAAASQPLATDLCAVMGRPADAVAPMPYAPPTSPPRPPPGSGRVLAVGRLVAEKGHADLVAAVHRLRRAGRDRLSLTIVGDGPEQARLERLAERWDVPLSLPGALSPVELEGAYAAADVVVVPSHREGFGLVAVEALARHRPVVVSDVGGLSVVVEDGLTGWKVPPRDPRRLADAIAAVLDHPDEGRRRAEAGARAVTRRWSAASLGRDAAARLAALAR